MSQSIEPLLRLVPHLRAVPAKTPLERLSTSPISFYLSSQNAACVRVDKTRYSKLHSSPPPPPMALHLPRRFLLSHLLPSSSVSTSNLFGQRGVILHFCSTAPSSGNASSIDSANDICLRDNLDRQQRESEPLLLHGFFPHVPLPTVQTLPQRAESPRTKRAVTTIINPHRSEVSFKGSLTVPPVIASVSVPECLASNN